MDQISERTRQLLARRRAASSLTVADIADRSWSAPATPSPESEPGGLVIVGVRMTFLQYLRIAGNVSAAFAVLALIGTVISAVLAALFKWLL